MCVCSRSTPTLLGRILFQQLQASPLHEAPVHCFNTRHDVGERWALIGIGTEAVVCQVQEGSRAVWRELRKCGVSHRPTIGQLDPGSDASAMHATAGYQCGGGRDSVS